MDAAKFNDYLLHDGMPHVLAWRMDDGTLGEPADERYSKHVKALFAVGGSIAGPFATPLGLELEIVPLANPLAARVGGTLPVRVLWNDSRPEALARQAWDNMETHTGDAVDLVARCEPGAAVVVLTPSHALDYAITEAALRRDDLAYVGLIGSGTKRRRFERWFTARGGADTALARLVCPIGDVGIIDKRPPIIAAFAATEILRALLRARTGAEQDRRCHETV